MIPRSQQRRLLCFALGLLSCSLVLTTTPASAAFKPSPKASVVSSVSAPNWLDQGRQLYRSGRIAEAIQAWQTAAQTYRTSRDRSNEALSLSYLSLAQQELSQWEDATRSIDQSLALLKSAKPAAEAILWAQAFNTQASLLLHTGKAEAALDSWQQAQKYYEQAGDQAGSWGAQINQAQALQGLGYYRRAKQQLTALNQKLVELPDSELKVSGLRSLGSILQSMGDSTQAQAAFEKGLAIAKPLKNTTELSAILSGLGKTSIDLHDPDTALNYFEQAEQAATNPLEKLQARLDRFKLLIDYDLPEKAKPLAPQLFEQLQQLPPSRTALYGAINFVASLNQLEEPLIPLPDLAKLLSSTVQAAQQSRDAQAEAYALHQLGRLYGRTQQWTEAEKATEKSLTIARQLQADDIIAQSAWQLGRLYLEQNQKTKAISPYTEAVKALSAIRGDLTAINSNVQFSFRESVEPIYRELVGLLLDDQPSQAQLVQARELIESLQVAELDNFFREACLDKVRQIDQVDPTATVVYPIVLPDRLAVILSTAGQPLRYYVTEKPQEEIEQTLGQLLSALNPVSDSRDRNRLSQQVYDWLIRPAEQAQAFQNTKTLVFVLDGRLRNIPMAALYDGKQYLIEKYAVTLSPGLQLMAARSLQQTNLNAIVGGISESRAGFAALPAVESEVKQIASTVAATKMLNQSFTGDALSDRLKNSRSNVVHLATHGQFSSRLEDTFLLTWDGTVNVKELSELLQTRDTSKAIDLLVLSACDTATGDDRAVLGLAGLAVKSGARSTVATLWPVKDKAAAMLMTQFYQQLKHTGTTKAEALRQAQIKLIRETDFKEPFFWSAFVLVGNWQ